MNLYPDLMLDVETLGHSRDAAVISLAALRFGRTSRLLDGPSFYRVVKMVGDVGTIDPEAIVEWMEQNQGRRDSIFSRAVQADAQPIGSVLSEFSMWLASPVVERLWSNGPVRDEKLVREANQRRGPLFPVGFRQSRCCISYYDLAQTLLAKSGGLPSLQAETRTRIPAGVSSINALQDCYQQAGDMQTIYQMLVRA
jgi:hypothetical protein